MAVVEVCAGLEPISSPDLSPRVNAECPPSPLELVQPVRLRTRTRSKRSRYSRLSDIDADLRAHPFELNDVERAFGQLRTVDPLAQRITSCILGVPS